MTPTTVGFQISKQMINEVESYISKHKPVAYEDLMEIYVTAPFVLGFFRAAGTDYIALGDVFIRNMDAAREYEGWIEGIARMISMEKGGINDGQMPRRM